MKATIAISLATLTALFAAGPSRSAEPGNARAYAGIGLGVSSFDIDRVSSTRNTDDGVLRIYGGYQLKPRFGVEAGYMRTGHFVETREVDGLAVSQEATTRALYVAATGRLPVTASFAVTGQIGLAVGDVGNDAPPPGADSVFGSKSSVMIGIGAQYRVSDRLSLALDANNIAAESRRVATRSVMFSVRRSF